MLSHLSSSGMSYILISSVKASNSFSEGGQRWLQGEVRNLQWFADNGSFEERDHAGQCLSAIQPEE